MAPSTHELEQQFARLGRLIARIEAKPHTEWVVWSSTLHELVAEREAIRFRLLDRRIEAAKPVVSLRRWRDGPGAAPDRVSPRAAGGRAAPAASSA